MTLVSTNASNAEIMQAANSVSQGIISKYNALIMAMLIALLTILAIQLVCSANMAIIWLLEHARNAKDVQFVQLRLFAGLIATKGLLLSITPV